jgi:hypothetical protein
VRHPDVDAMVAQASRQRHREAPGPADLEAVEQEQHPQPGAGRGGAHAGRVGPDDTAPSATRRPAAASAISSQR